MKVSELIATPDKWCQRAWAKTKDGKNVIWDSPDAACWCLSAACFVAENGCEVRRRIDASQVSMAEWNDTHTHAEVLALVLEAEAAPEPVRAK